jgi:hypothetical protein
MKQGVKVALIVFGVLSLIALAFFIWWILSLLGIVKHTIISGRKNNYSASLSSSPSPSNFKTLKKVNLILVTNDNSEEARSTLRRVRSILAGQRKHQGYADAKLATESDINHLMKSSFQNYPLWIESSFLHNSHNKQILTRPDLQRGSVAVSVMFDPSTTNPEKLVQALQNNGIANVFIA